MNAAHLHLLLNHLPLVGALGGGLLLAYGLLRRSDDVVRASLWALVLVGLAAVAVYLTGEPAEELVEELAGISEAALEAHEEAALWAAIGGGATAAMAALGLVLYRTRRIARSFGVATLAVTAGLLGVMGWTANLGGQIRHSEIRPDEAATAPAELEEDEADEHQEGEEAGAPAPGGDQVAGRSAGGARQRPEAPGAR